MNYNFGYSPSIKNFRIFGSKYYIKRDDDIGKFDPRSDEGMFLGYSLNSKAFRCFNYRNKTIVECVNVRIDKMFGTKKNTFITSRIELTNVIISLNVTFSTKYYEIFD